MIDFRRLKHSDYEDIVDISKGVWGGRDYVPQVFHHWVDQKGFFLGAVDTEKDKVIAVGKYSILHDGSGWLEGLRVHKNYRGKKIARDLSERLLNIVHADLKSGSINKIAFGTHITNTESITLMHKLNFMLKEKFLIVTKEYDLLPSSLTLEDFKVEKWELTPEEFINLPYFKKRNNILPLAFVFQEPTKDLFHELKESGSFMIINGHKGIFKLKDDPHFIAVDDSFEGINTYMNYYLCKFNNKNSTTPLTSVLPEDIELTKKLKSNNFSSISNWEADYLLYIYKN